MSDSCETEEDPHSIPATEPPGLIPPFAGSPDDAGSPKSPYRTTLRHFVERFATSAPRRKIVAGLIEFRRKLRELGVFGRMWLAGSFVEDVETIRCVPAPKDIDVVLLVERHPNMSIADWKALNRAIIDLIGFALTHLYCDAYVIDLSRPPNVVVDDTIEYYALFSRTKDHGGAWKGFCEVALTETDDDDLAAWTKGGT